MDIPEGYGFVGGRETKTAVKLLKVNEEAGYPVDDVRAIQGGYLVHEDILDAYNESLDEEDEAISTEVDPFSLEAPNVTGGPGWTPSAPKAGRKKPSTAAAETGTPDAGEGENQTEQNSTDIGESQIATTEPGESEPTTDADGNVIAGKSDETVVTDENAGQVERHDGTIETGTITPEPAGNASKADWLTYAKTSKNYDESTDADLGRDELKAKFGAPAAE